MDIKKGISDIIALGYEVSTTTKSDAFVSYSGHTNAISGYAYIEGWKKNADYDWEFNIRLKKFKCENQEEFQESLEKKLSSVKDDLKSLLGGA